MRRSRPTIVTVIALLNLVIGAIGLLFSAGMLIMLLTIGGERAVNRMVVTPQVEEMQRKSTGFANDDIYAYREEHLPVYDTFQGVMTAVQLLVCVLMMVCGVGLLRMAPWARRWTIVYAILDLLAQAIPLGFFVLFVFPVLDAFFAGIETKNTQMEISQQFTQISWKFGYVAITGFWMIYPMVVLMLMLRPSMAQAFQAASEANKVGTEPAQG
jgi:hypothetical protein